MTRFSVALPVRNGADYLRQALDSILAQEHEDFELVVSDNASTDETPSILAEYVRRDSRVRVSRTESLIPQADNVNRAVELASHSWVKLFCHDDVMYPECLAVLADTLRRVGDAQVGLIGHGEEWLFANGHRYGRFVRGEPVEPLEFDGRALLRRVLTRGATVDLPAVSNALVRKEAWRSAGGFDRRYVHFDIFLWARLLLEWKYVYIPRVLITYRIHGAQVAVSARKNMSSVDDHRRFWREFLREAAPVLGLGWQASALARLRGVSTAGAYLAIELFKRDLAGAARLARVLPLTWWPILPLFAVRSLIAERRRIRPYRHAVPLSLIYPG